MSAPYWEPGTQYNYNDVVQYEGLSRLPLYYQVFYNALLVRQAIGTRLFNPIVLR